MSRSQTNSTLAVKEYSILLFVIGCLPLMMLIFWHMQHHHLPNDDAANYAYTAAQIYQEFEDNGIVAGLRGMYLIRGWRPIIFPIFAVPFFILFNGNIQYATSGTLCLFYGILQWYTYLYFRQYLKRGASVIGCIFMVSLPWIVHWAYVFYAEIGMLAFFMGAAYHAEQSKFWSSHYHSIWFALNFGILLTMRPEAVLIALIGMLYLIGVGLWYRYLNIYDFIAAVYTMFVLLALFAIRIFPQQSLFLTLITLIVYMSSLGIFAKLEQFSLNRGLLIFLITLAMLIGIWYLPYARETFNWVYTTSMGDMIHLYKGTTVAGFLPVLRFIFGNLGMWQLTFLSGIIISSIVCFRYVNQRALLSNMGMVFLGVSHLSVIIILMMLSGGGDIRRSFIGGYALFVGLFVLACNSKLKGYLVRLTCVACFASLQLVVLGASYGQFEEAIHQRTYWLGTYQPPFQEEEPSSRAMREIKKYLSVNAQVCTLSMAMNSFENRIFDPAALNLISLIDKSSMRFGYPWNFETLGEGYKQIDRFGYEYILLDSRTLNGHISENTLRQPYSRLTTDLISRTQNDALAEVGWEPFVSFMIDDIPLKILRKLYPHDRLLSFSNNLASAKHGAIGWANSSQKGYRTAYINDDSDLAWGSTEGNDDVVAGITLSVPVTPQRIKMMLFSPDGRAHLREISVVATNDNPNSKPQWAILKSRFGAEGPFTKKITVPPYEDKSIVTLEIDPLDPNIDSYKTVGIACFRESRGYRPNWIQEGSGVYFREMQIAGIISKGEVKK